MRQRWPSPTAFGPRTSASGWLHRNLYDHPSEADRYQMIRTYFRMLIEEELPDAVGKMKQFASWFTHGVPGGAHCARKSTNRKARRKFSARVEDFFEARLYVSVPQCGPDALVREL